MSSSTDTRRFSPLSATGAVSLVDERAGARAAGYAEGWAAGRRDAHVAAARAAQDAQQLADRHETARGRAVDRALGALQAAARDHEERTLPDAHELADLVVDTALELARTVLAAELAVVDGRAEAALRRAVAPLTLPGPVVVRLHPADVETLTSVVVAGRIGAHEVELVPDASLAVGDAVADQGAARVDARILAGLDRAATAMRTGERA